MTLPSAHRFDASRRRACASVFPFTFGTTQRRCVGGGQPPGEPHDLGRVPEVLRALAELVAEVTGFAGEIRWDTSMPNGQPRRALDASRARELFGFAARTPLREGIERTVAWYREHAYAPSRS